MFQVIHFDFIKLFYFGIEINLKETVKSIEVFQEGQIKLIAKTRMESLFTFLFIFHIDDLLHLTDD